MYQMRKANASSNQKNWKKIKKVLDKLLTLWYNIIVVEGTAPPKTANKKLIYKEFDNYGKSKKNH